MIAESIAVALAVSNVLFAWRLLSARKHSLENGALKGANNTQLQRNLDLYVLEHRQAERLALQRLAERDEWEARAIKAEAEAVKLQTINQQTIARAAFAERQLAAGRTEDRETPTERALKVQLLAAQDAAQDEIAQLKVQLLAAQDEIAQLRGVSDEIDGETEEIHS